MLLYISILVIAFVTGGVYAWQHSKVTTLDKKVQAQAAQVATLKGQVTKFEQSIKASPTNKVTGTYAGWKTFCDTLNSACFDYPKDWAIAGTSTTQKTTEAVNNPNNTVSIQYEDPYVHDKLDQVFYISAIEDMQVEDSNLKIVGRVIGNSPDYVVIDASYITTNNVSVGKSLSFVDTARFSDKSKKGTTILFKAAPTSPTLTTIKNPDQATAWFKSDDAKMALKILQSLYYQ